MMESVNMLSDVAVALPHLVLALGALALITLGAFAGKNGFAIVRTASVLVLTIALWAVWKDGAMGGPARAFSNMLLVNNFTQLLSSALIVFTGFAILTTGGVDGASPLRRFELPTLMVLALLGMVTMVSANDVLVVYMGMELMSLPLYVLAALNRNTGTASEAGLKYFVLGALSSGLFLFGASFLYGVTGTTQFDVMHASLSAMAADHAAQIVLVLALAFLLSALAFKVSAVPFHMWTPDVYQGAAMPVTAFFAGAPKVAAMGLLISMLYGPLSGQPHIWVQIIVLISAASMLLGAFAGVVQKSVKRMLAYSSIANMGYALMGVVAASATGVSAALLYLLIYGVMTAGVFAVLVLLRRKGAEVDAFDDFKGLSVHHKPAAYTLTLFLFAMSGLPPMAGFFGKLAVFQAAVAADFLWLAILGIVCSVVAAYYYLNLIRVMFFDAPADEATRTQDIAGPVAVATLATVFVLLYIVFPQSLATLSDAAAASFSLR